MAPCMDRVSSSVCCGCVHTGCGAPKYAGPRIHEASFGMDPLHLSLQLATPSSPASRSSTAACAPAVSAGGVRVELPRHVCHSHDRRASATEALQPLLRSDGRGSFRAAPHRLLCGGCFCWRKPRGESAKGQQQPRCQSRALGCSSEEEAGARVFGAIWSSRPWHSIRCRDWQQRQTQQQRKPQQRLQLQWCTASRARQVGACDA